jgi:hypothetical protein
MGWVIVKFPCSVEELHQDRRQTFELTSWAWPSMVRAWHPDCLGQLVCRGRNERHGSPAALPSITNVIALLWLLSQLARERSSPTTALSYASVGAIVSIPATQPTLSSCDRFVRRADKFHE